VAAVSPAAATGTVTFKEGSTVLGTASLAVGFAHLPLANLPIGSHLIFAVYGRRRQQHRRHLERGGAGA